MAALDDPQTFRFRNQQREGMPDEVEPPTPPTIVPPGGQEGQQGTGWPDQTPVATPQGDQERDQQREQSSTSDSGGGGGSGGGEKQGK